MGDPKVCVTTATLDLERGIRVVNEVRAKGGIPSFGYVVEDRLGVGGTKPANRGLRYCFERLDVPFICYINDDISFKTTGWLRDLVKALEDHPRIAVVGAGGKCRTTPQTHAKPGMAPGVQYCERLAYFCVVFRREIFEEIGFLDESYAHYGCDSDFNKRVLHAGWKLGWVKHVWATHNVGAVIPKFQKKDSALYRKMWGDG